MPNSNGDEGKRWPVAERNSVHDVIAISGPPYAIMAWTGMTPGEVESKDKDKGNPTAADDVALDVISRGYL
jgi:hypothetical protein